MRYTDKMTYYFVIRIIEIRVINCWNNDKKKKRDDFVWFLTI